MMKFIITFLSLPLALVSCDAITANTPLGGQCHDRTDGSVLKAVEDANGKEWPVVKYPLPERLGPSSVCGVRLGAAMYRATPHPRETHLPAWTRSRWWLHPETGERIEGGILGSHEGTLDIDTQRYEWY